MGDFASCVTKVSFVTNYYILECSTLEERNIGLKATMPQSSSIGVGNGGGEGAMGA